VPNLIADRSFGVTCGQLGINVRRLMYQTLIWARKLSDDPSSLRTALHAEDLKRLSDALIDGVRGDAELRCDLL
jgi:hypothetical protein